MLKLIKIKTWDEMEKEFGLNELGEISCGVVFMKPMELEMPKNRIIVVNYTNHIYKWVKHGYFISKNVIEEELDVEKHPQYFI